MEPRSKDVTAKESLEVVRKWADKRTVAHPGSALLVSKAHKDYINTCHTWGAEPYGIHWFSRTLNALGFKTKVLWYRTGSKRAYDGFALKGESCGRNVKG